MRMKLLWSFLPLVAVAGIGAAAALPPPPAVAHDAVLQALKFREIGPAVMGGRVDAIAVVENDPKIAYVGLASGGVWKTVNGFTTWKPVFDDQPVASIGAVTVAPSDPAIVWVGTGEANTRQSSSWGNGVYRSMDAGKTWEHMGLDDSQHIARIVVDPHDPNTVYVAAQGHLWGPNHQRGVFKTSDAGKTWTPVLFISDNTGATDLVMDPRSPGTLYAAMYQHQRTVAGYSGGGPESGIYKTVDGGAHWTRLTAGIPAGDLGRIALTIFRHDPDVLYALVESSESGVYRSNDKGETWAKMGSTDPRPSYFSQIRVDPNNDQRVWIGGVSLGSSDDGGRTFRNSTLGTRNGIAGSMHEDFHDVWIDPADSDHMIAGNDGGIYVTWDAGNRWEKYNNVAIGQFYGISYDFRQPYNVCGGLQDNDSWCGPSNSLVIRGSSNDEWLKVGGGDGMYSQVDPKDPDIIYAEGQEGNLTRRDLRTQQSRSIRVPEPAAGEARYRFQWTAPFIISNFDNKTLYIGGNYVFKSTDRGDSWTRLGNDLTTGADRNQMPILGKMPSKSTLSRNDGVTFYPAITTLAESPARAGLLWAGTDDGNVQVSRDDGKTWKNVVGNMRVPKGTYVSRVLPSMYAEGTAFVAFDGHRSNDFTPYLFMTTDFGEHWNAVSSGLPRNTGTVHVVIEHFRNPNLMFAGTEMGLFVSFNRGQKWEELKNNFPRVPVFDLKIHTRDNDLIIGTHGRSIWILDDIAPLEQLSEQVLAADAYLFDVRPAVEWRLMDAKSAIGHAFYIADNPPYGAIIDYSLKASGAKPKLEILDKDGKLVRTLTDLPTAVGVNRTLWDLRTDSPAGTRGGAGEQGGGRGGGGARGIFALPGEYTAQLTVGTTQLSRKFQLQDDLRVTLSPEDSLLRAQTLTALFALAKEASAPQRRFTALRASVDALRASWKRPDAPAVPESAKEALEQLDEKMDAIQKETSRGALEAGTPLEKYNPPPVADRINTLLSAVDGYALRPTDAQIAQLAGLKAELPPMNEKIRHLIDEDLPAANKAINAAGIAALSANGRAAPARDAAADNHDGDDDDDDDDD